MSTPDFSATYAAHLDVIKQRADEALNRAGLDHLVVPSGTAHLRAFDDCYYPYAANPQFKAWLPLTRNPGSWLVYTPGQTPKLIYLQPFDYWHSVPSAPSGWWTRHFDIVVIRKPEDALQHLPGNASRCAVLGEPQSALGNYGAYKPNNPIEVIHYLEYHRAFKTPYEIAMMREATRRGVRGHRAAERLFRAGASEFGIHLGYCQAVGQDATELPYNNIVALDEHGAVLHYGDLDRVPPRAARSFLIDAGADFGGYACDITRTYATDTGGEFQAMIDAVDKLQRGDIAERFRAGNDYRQIHLYAHLGLACVLKDFGILKMSPEAAVETGVSATFFPHGLGHGIGLQVHEVAGFAASDSGGTIAKPDGHPYLRLTRTLEPGMVVTNEPGLYFVDMLLDELRQGAHADAVDWDRVDAFRPYGGIRIEDDVVVTEDAPINLTREAFATAD